MVAFKDAKNATSFALAIQTRFLDHDWGTTAIDERYTEIVSELYPDFVAAIPPHASSTWTSTLATPGTTTPWSGLRVRIGVSYGVGDVRLDDTKGGYDYYGTVVNTAARVEGVAHGGQVLLTDDALNGLGAARGAVLKDARVVSLGPHPLRGLDNEVVLHQIDLVRFSTRAFPPLRLDVEIELEDDGGDALTNYSSSDKNDTTTDASKTNSKYGVKTDLAADGASLLRHEHATKKIAAALSAGASESRGSVAYSPVQKATFGASATELNRTRNSSASPNGEGGTVGVLPIPGDTTTVPSLQIAGDSAGDELPVELSHALGAPQKQSTRTSMAVPGGGHLTRDPLSCLLFVHGCLATAFSTAQEKQQRTTVDRMAANWRIRQKAKDHQVAAQWGHVSVSLMHVALKVIVAMESKGRLAGNVDATSNAARQRSVAATER